MGECNEVGNCPKMVKYNSDETSSTHKKEVKAEVVDRNSVYAIDYGEGDEEWENAAVVDNNQYYEC